MKLINLVLIKMFALMGSREHDRVKGLMMIKSIMNLKFMVRIKHVKVMPSARTTTSNSPSSPSETRTMTDSSSSLSLRDLLLAATTMKLVGKFATDFEALCYVTLAARGGYLLQTEFERILNAKQSNVSRALGQLEESGLVRRNTEFNPAVVIMEVSSRPRQLFEQWKAAQVHQERHVREFFAELVHLAGNDYDVLARLLQEHDDLRDMVARQVQHVTSERGARVLQRMLEHGRMTKKNEVIVERSNYPEYHHTIQLELEQARLISSFRHLNDVYLVFMVPPRALFETLVTQRFRTLRDENLREVERIVTILERCLERQHQYLRQYGRILLTNKQDVRRRLTPAFRRYSRAWLHLGVVDGVHATYDAAEVALLGEFLDVIADSTRQHTQLDLYFSPPQEPITTLITTSWRTLLERMKGSIRLYMIHDSLERSLVDHLPISEHLLLLERHAVMRLQRDAFKGSYDIRPVAITQARIHFERLRQPEMVTTTLMWKKGERDARKESPP